MATHAPAYEREILGRVQVRPILQGEYPRWRELMREHHYLGFERVAGERILYVATFDCHWVALLCWATAALHVRCRDAWIGWDQVVKRRRLQLVANNCRFLILDEFRVKNLASRVLALNLRRLSADWQQFCGHPILLAETFVDSMRFRGSCYRAAGWTCVGQTEGYSRDREVGYRYHGNPKWSFVQPLVKNAQERLANPMVEMKNGSPAFTIDVRKLPMEGKNGLIDVLKSVNDPRVRQGRRHPQLAVLAPATCAMLSGARGYKAIWEYANHLTHKQRIRLRCRGGIVPSLSTYERVLKGLDANNFDVKVNAWLFRVGGGVISRLAVDGKTLRGSRNGPEGKAIHLLSALLHEERIVVAQCNVDGKTNEITQFEPLLKDLPLDNALVTADALHCQVRHAIFLVREKNAHYLFTVKDNQHKLLEWVKALCEKHAPWDQSSFTRKAHGRIDTQTLSLYIPEPNDLRDTNFPFITQVVKTERSRIEKGKQSEEVSFAITSVGKDRMNGRDLLAAQLGHWQIENGSHYVRDDSMGEDRSRIRKGSGPQVMAALRNAAIGIMRLAGGDNVAAGLRDFGWGSKERAMRAIGLGK